MKKIIALICTIACIFGLTACGDEVTYTEYEQQKLDYAKDVAIQQIIPILQLYSEEENISIFAENTAEEVEYIIGNQFQVNVDGNAMLGAITSFSNGTEVIGAITYIDEANTTTEIQGKTIIVTVPVTGELKDGNVQIIFSNDMFVVLESAALNEKATKADALARAGLNTIIGMGTVFIVLILISFIISLFGYIPKIQAWFENRKKKDEVKEVSIDNTIAQIVEMEQVEEDATDDLELVAVIAAAIAASEGAASTDGFVVRSVRKVGRRK